MSARSIRLAAVAIAALCCLVAIAGCGGGGGSSPSERVATAAETAQAAPAPEPAPKPEPEPEAIPKPEPEPAPKSEPQGPTQAQIREAEAIVKDELPSTPIWKGTTFHGVATANGDVCVERTHSKHTAELFGGGRSAGFVVVSIPTMTAGEPQDGTCGKPKPKPNERLSGAELESMDSALTAAIEGGDSSEIVAYAQRIKNKIDKPLPVTTKQANLIHSATVAAIEGAETGNPKQLEAALRYLAEA